MNTNQGSNTDLLLKHSLKLNYALSLAIALLMAAASVAGLLFPTITYPTDELIKAFLVNDGIMLFIGLPMLLVSMWLTRRGVLIGLLFWPGALLFTLYNYIIYVFAMPVNVAFLLHLALITLSVYSLVILLVSIDGKAVERGLTGVVPARLTGGILSGLGFLFFLRAIGVMINALINQTTIAETELALNISDFIITPAWVICGVLLWRRRAFGYVTGLGLLFQASMLFIGLIILMLIQPMLTAEPIAFFDVLVVFIMGLICFIPFALFVRGVVSSHSSLNT